jgi:sodium/hydrogen antiporter
MEVTMPLGGGALLDRAQRNGWMAPSMQQLDVAMLPLLCIPACEPVGVSMFIAAYLAGLTAQRVFPDAGSHSAEFAEGWGLMFNFVVFLLFGIIVARTIGHVSTLHVLYAVISLTVGRMLPVAISLAGTGLSTSTTLFMGWFGPRGLASIVLGLVYLVEEIHLPGEETIKLAVIVTVLVSIFAHGFSALPGIGWYARRVTELWSEAPERQG